MSEWQLFAVTVLGFPVLIGTVYALSRAASIAHFRTKLEYFRSILREGKSDGKR